MVPYASDESLSTELRNRIEARVADYLNGLDLNAVVHQQRESLAAEWEDAQRRRILAPGEELVQAVFARFGVNYKKPEDTARIARHMEEAEIGMEIRTLIDRVVELSAPN